MGQSEGFIKQIMAFPGKLMQFQTLLFFDTGGFLSNIIVHRFQPEIDRFISAFLVREQDESGAVYD